MKIHNSVKITAVTMNFAVKITSPFPYLSLKSTAGAFRYFSVHDNKKFHDLLSFCYHSQRWNFEAEQRQLRLDQHSRLRFLPQSGFGNLWRIWLLSKPVGKTAKTFFFYFKKSKYGSNSPHMSLIKIADRCASSSTNRITPSPECRASQSLYETIAVFLFARLPPRALLAALPLARDSCSATFPRGFSSKRETACSLYKNVHGTMPQDLLKRFEVLKKCRNKFDCLVYEMLFIRTLKPNLNVQSDSIRAKVFS